MKILINTCYGGFGLSPLAVKRYNELKGRSCFFFHQEAPFRSAFVPLPSDVRPSLGLFYAFDVPEVPNKPSNAWWAEHCVKPDKENRTDPLLVQVVEELGKAANGTSSNLRVIEIPDGIEWEVDDYDGIETIHEKHRFWS